MSWEDLSANSGAEISNLFASYFKSTFSTTNLNSGSHQPFSGGDKVNLCDLYANFDQVYKQLTSLNTKKGAEPDGLPNLFLRNCAVGLCEPITHIFEKSLQHGIFPTVWKLSFVSPIHKSGPRSEIVNYRPVCIQSALAKLFEKVVLPQITTPFGRVMSSKQHGFVGGRSTTTNLYVYVNYILNAMNSGIKVHAIYTDFSKAFDKVDHEILLKKLDEYGITGNALNWIGSYLSGRRLQVRINEHVSDEYFATSGVPQGSHLGPILFNIFVNDIGRNFQSDYLLYADDLKIFRMITSIRDSHILQNDLDKLCDWCRENKLDLNIKKCAVMSFSRAHMQSPTNYKLNGQTIAEVEDIKDLGIIVDSSLTFHKHIEKISMQAYKVLGLITRTCRDFKNINALKSLFSALVLPILEYGSVIWSPSTDSMINTLERVQYKFCKTALYRNRHISDTVTVDEVRRVLRINELKYRRQTADLIFFFKLFNGLIDSPEIRNDFEFIPNALNLRQCRILKTTKSNKNYVINGPKNRICNLVNSMHSNINFFQGSYENFRSFIRKRLLEY